MKKNIESIKTVHLAILPTSVAEIYPIPMHIGEKEIAIVKASLWQVVNKGVANGACQLWLYRKSKGPSKNTDWTSGAGEIVGSWQLDDSVEDTVLVRTTTGEKVLDYRVYPEPFIFIRPPSLIAKNNGAVEAVLTLFYTLEQIDSKQLSKLMVKDHA